MKRLLIALCLAVGWLFSTAQNGGQYAENNSLLLTYAGLQTGTHYVQITNKLNKQIVAKVDYAGQATEITITANGVYMWPIGAQPPSLLIRAKNLYCAGNDCGWVELCIATLPVKFTNFTCQNIGGDDFLVRFTIGEASNVKQFNVQLSVDGGKTYKGIAVVWPDALQPNKQYSLKLKIKK